MSFVYKQRTNYIQDVAILHMSTFNSKQILYINNTTREAGIHILEMILGKLKP